MMSLYLHVVKDSSVGVKGHIPAVGVNKEGGWVVKAGVGGVHTQGLVVVEQHEAVVGQRRLPLHHRHVRKVRLRLKKDGDHGDGDDE